MDEKIDKERYLNFDEYIRQGEPSQREAAYRILPPSNRYPASTPQVPHKYGTSGQAIILIL